jgi:putative phosphoribosyl transferase
MANTQHQETRRVQIEAGDVALDGDLGIPGDARSLVAFAHGSGSSRHSPRNRRVAEFLRLRGIGTLLFDLLTPEEDERDRMTRELRFDIDLLGSRLTQATNWCLNQPDLEHMRLGYFGASTGAAAALVAATRHKSSVHAVVSRGGRPDLAELALSEVQAPTLLIVGENDPTVLRLNQDALLVIHAKKELKIVPGATHLFEEPGALDEVARMAADWFRTYLTDDSPKPSAG